MFVSFLHFPFRSGHFFHFCYAFLSFNLSIHPFTSLTLKIFLLLKHSSFLNNHPFSIHTPHYFFSSFTYTSFLYSELPPSIWPVLLFWVLLPVQKRSTTCARSASNRSTSPTLTCISKPGVQLKCEFKTLLITNHSETHLTTWWLRTFFNDSKITLCFQQRTVQIHLRINETLKTFKSRKSRSKGRVQENPKENYFWIQEAHKEIETSHKVKSSEQYSYSICTYTCFHRLTHLWLQLHAFHSIFPRAIVHPL